MDEVVIAQHVPWRAWIALTVIPAAAIVFLLVAIVAPSFNTVAAAVVAIVALGMVSVETVQRWRRIGSLAPTIVATAEGLGSPLWRIAWSEVASLSIGPFQSFRSMRVLRVEARSSESIAWESGLRLSAWANAHWNNSELRIFERNVNRPLEDIAVDFERLAGRPLLAR